MYAIEKLAGAITNSFEAEKLKQEKHTTSKTKTLKTRMLAQFKSACNAVELEMLERNEDGYALALLRGFSCMFNKTIADALELEDLECYTAMLINEAKNIEAEAVTYYKRNKLT